MKPYDFGTLFAVFVLYTGLMLATAAVIDCTRSAHAAPPTIGGLDLGGGTPETVSTTVGTTYKSPYLPMPGPADPEDEEARLVFVAAHGCALATNRHFRPDAALRFLRAEEDAGIGPDHPLRGISLAQWCGEAAYGLGDEVCARGPCDGGRARGPLQLHPGYARMCAGLPYGGPPTDEADVYRDVPEAAVRCLMQQVLRVYSTRAQRLVCKTEADRWFAAQYWVARGTPPTSCTALSGHGHRLMQWRKSL